MERWYVTGDSQLVHFPHLQKVASRAHRVVTHETRWMILIAMLQAHDQEFFWRWQGGESQCYRRNYCQRLWSSQAAHYPRMVYTGYRWRLLMWDSHWQVWVFTFSVLLTNNELSTLTIWSPTVRCCVNMRSPTWTLALHFWGCQDLLDQHNT